MDFLFDNPLGNMPGVIFLTFYSLFAIITLLVFAIWKSQADQTARLPIPPISPNIDPYEVAYLRGGINEVARAITFSLRQKDFLIIEIDGRNSRIHRNQLQTDSRALSQIDQAALNWFAVAREPNEVFKGDGLTEVLTPYYEFYETRLEQQQLLIDAATRSRVKRARNVVLLSILGLGIYKFLAAVTAGYQNVFGIVIIGIVAAIITFAVAKLPRLSKLGKNYLERLQIAFDKLKHYDIRHAVQANVPAAQFSGVDPLLLGVGVFGGAILAGTAYEDYNQAFQRAQNQAAGGSGCGSASCGSSCSSSSGDSGGGSDGGGCGGGCGGCGGGGD